MTDPKFLVMSDIHVGMSNQDWLWPTVKHAFFDDIRRLHMIEGNWDFVIFSGDLTQKGTADEYEKFNEIITEIWNVFHDLGFNPPLIVLPGNHDICRPNDDLPAVAMLKQWWDQPKARSKFFDDRTTYRTVIDDAFSSYLAWLNSPLPNGIEFSPFSTGILPGDSSTVLHLNGFRIGVVCLNSTWLQLGAEDYQGKLHVDPKQLLSVTDRDPTTWCRKNHFNILVSHHPVSWLEKSSLQTWKREINPPGRFNLHLFGHLHEGHAELKAVAGGAPQPSFQSRSMFGLESVGDKITARSHGYALFALKQGDTHRDLLVYPRLLQETTAGVSRMIADYNFELVDDKIFKLHSWLSPRKRLETHKNQQVQDVPKLQSDEFEEYLDDEQRDRLLEIARKHAFPSKRPVLIAPIPSGFASGMPKLQDDDAQLVADIDYLRNHLSARHNSKGLVSPFAKWLERGVEQIRKSPDVDELRAFLNAVKVTFGKYSPQDQNARNYRIEDTLRKTLRQFYLPFLTEHLMAENSDVRSLAVNLEDAIKRQVAYDKKVFVKDLRRRITVSWHGEGRETIKVSDRSQFEFVPFTHDDIIWKAKRYATGELATDDYHALNDEIRLSGTLVKGIEVKEEGGQTHTTTYKIDVKANKPPFAMTGSRDIYWKLDSDPMYEQGSPYVVQGCELTIENSAPGLRLTFHDVGGTDLFSPLPKNDGDYKWDVIPSGEVRVLSSVPVLLPEQGCILIMSRTLVGLDESMG